MPDLHGVTVEEWHKGGGDMTMELLDGQVLQLHASSGAHAVAVNRIAVLLADAAGDRAVVKSRNPVVLDETSEPRPDVAVLRPRPGGYAASPARPGDILLLIEVADRSITYDRGRKASYYSRSRVPECWVVDLAGDQILSMRSPASGGYRDIRNLRRGSRITLESVEGVSFQIDDLLGPDSGAY